MQNRGTYSKKILVIALALMLGAMAMIPVATSQAKATIITPQARPDACPSKEFLESALEELLGTVSPVNLAYYQTRLDQGASREQVVEMILQSFEGRTNRVQNIFHKFLGRPATQPELDFYCSALEQGMTEEEVICTVL